MEKTGASLKANEVREVHRGLYKAARRYFGSWGNAVEAAGIDREVISNYRTWTATRVLDAIHKFDRQGVPLNSSSIFQTDCRVLYAARKIFGSWDDALRAAGYDPHLIRLNRPRWTREGIIALLQKRAKDGLSVAARNIVPTAAVPAAQRLFGSWASALKAAGMICPPAGRPYWSRVSIVEEILTRQQANRPLDCTTAIKEVQRLYSAASRHFGSWSEALRAAGIDPRSVRRRPPRICGRDNR